MTGAEIIIKSLEKQGVEYVFGYPGGSVIPLFDAILDSHIKLVLVRHEQGAVHMADGYARATGKPGVALVTSGPGATNTVTGLLTAQMDSSPIIVLCGQTITANLGKDAFQEADVFNITVPVVKHSYLLSKPNDVARVMREAFHICQTGRPGPVLIDIPKDTSAAEFDTIPSDDMDLPGYRLQSQTDEDKLKQVATLLKASERPVILAGQGVVISGASRELYDLATTLQAPVTTTLLGKGAFPENHPLSLGMLGMHGTAYSNFAVMNCDLIISIGSRWDDRITSKVSEFCPEATKIHIDIDPAEINKIVRVDAAIVGDARVVLKDLLPMLSSLDTSKWLARVEDWKNEYPLCYEKEENGEMTMQYVLDRLNDLTKSQAIVVTDVGQHQMWAAQFLRTETPRSFISSGGAGTMGFGLPAAIGAQIGKPESLVTAIIGDGGFQMTLFELATANLMKLPLKIFVMNNNYLGMVRQWQSMFYDDRLSGVDLEGNPDFVKLAESYGIRGMRITKSDEVDSALQEALDYDEGPILVECLVERHANVFPFIPAGAPLQSMMVKHPGQKMDKPTGST